MYGIFQEKGEDDILRLILAKFNLTNGQRVNIQTEKNEIYYIEKYTYAYFDNNNMFYYFTCNNISDLKSGYLKEKLGKKSVKNEFLSVERNNKTPFEFLKYKDSFKIKTIKFIRKTKYV